MAERLTCYDSTWIDTLDASAWLKCSTKGLSFAFCTACGSHLDVSNGGISCVRRHSQTVKHKAALKMAATSAAITNFFPSNSSTASTPKEIGLCNKEATVAELRWIWHSVEKSKSFLCEDQTVSLLQVMFPDSKIAANMSCARSKQVYTLNFAIAPYCRQSQQEDVKGRFFSLSFDEADGRLGIIIRYVSFDGSVRTELLDLVPLVDFTSTALTDVILKAVQDAALPQRLWLTASSDNCNAMRGRHGGVLKLLRDTPSLDHLLDIGGCPLHVVSNAYKHMSDQFQDIVQFADDVYTLFSRSIKKSKSLAKMQNEIYGKGAKFLRNVQTRWLSLLPCLERLDNQWVALGALLEEQTGDANNLSPREKGIMATYTYPTTRVAIRFLVYLLRFSQSFETRFQSAEVLIHDLFPSMVALLTEIAVQFMKTEAIHDISNIWLLDFENVVNQVPLTDVLIGSDAKALLLPLKESLRQTFFLKAKRAYTTLAKYLAANLPFKKKFLHHVTFLDLKKRPSVDEDKAMNCAKLMPSVILASDLDHLTKEIRLFNLLDKTEQQAILSASDIPSSWEIVRKMTSSDGSTQRFPFLSRLAAGCCTLFHGNADIERIFGKSSDIDASQKRSSMSDELRKNCLIAKSYLSSRSLTATDVSIPPKLVEMALRARAEEKHFQKTEMKRQQAEELARLAAKQKAEMERALKDDEERKSLLKVLAGKTNEVQKEKDAAEKAQLEAELNLQKALSALSQANQMKETALQHQSQLQTDKDRIETAAMEKLLKQSAIKADELKRKHDHELAMRLPKIHRR